MKNLHVSVCRSFSSILCRYALYTAFLTALLGLLPHVLGPQPVAAFKEGGRVEWLQFGLAGVVTALLALGAWRLPRSRGLLSGLCVVAAVAMVREQDSAIQSLTPWLRWELPAGAILLAGALMLWPRRRRLASEFASFVSSTPFGVLWAALAVTTVVSQLVGHGAFLRIVMGEEYNRDYKRVIEEATELCGYVLLLVGTIETLVARRHGEVVAIAPASVRATRPAPAVPRRDVLPEPVLAMNRSACSSSAHGSLSPSRGPL